MEKNILNKVGWLIGLALLQVLVLNNVEVAGAATPWLYLYWVMKQESDMPPAQLMIWAFGLGLMVDIFSDTPGMNAAATVWLAFVRSLLLRLFMPRDLTSALVPSIRTLGMTPFLKYVTTGVLLHHSLLLTLEFFSWAHPVALLMRIVLSTLLTTACIMALDGIRRK